MSDPKIDRPQGPAAWESPTARPDGAPGSSDDQSFNDDVVAARVKGQEAALARQAGERLGQQVSRDVLRPHDRVAKARPFLPAAEGSDQGAKSPTPTARRGRAGAGPAARGAGQAPADRLEARLEAMMAALAGLEDELGEAAGQPPTGAQAQAAGGPRPTADARLLRLDAQLRHHFQELIAGALGFRLLADPRLSFRRLFDRMRRWPRRVRPGHRPDSDADFDAFLAWVFAPPPRPDTIDEPFALWGD